MVKFAPPGKAVAVLLAVLGLPACSEQQKPLAGSSARYLNVEGKRIQVRISPYGGPGEYRLMAARDAVVIDPDVGSERQRAEHAANYYMKQTCASGRYQVLESGMLDSINYFARFKCSG